MANHFTRTTSALDQAEADRLKEYLEEQSTRQEALDITSSSSRNGDNIVEENAAASSQKDIPSVFIDEGAHKYVVIYATEPTPRGSSGTGTGECLRRTFVVSQRGAPYHRIVAESFLPKLEETGYKYIHIQGGGRIYRNDHAKRIRVFGYSYGFGQGNHEEATQVIKSDQRFQQYDVTWSNDGY